jgi:protein arginine N-methyltransferase 7
MNEKDKAVLASRDQGAQDDRVQLTSAADWIDQLPVEIHAFVSQLRNHPHFAEHLVGFAHVLRKRRQAQDSVSRRLALQAWEMEPGNPKVRQAAEFALRKSVPNWHFRLVHDRRRNEIYEQALLQFVSPETTVLEIGAGSGILALLAARAGAKHVYTCEMEPLVAQAAQQNIARNGYADRITVIPKRSSDLVVGEDIPAPVDLLVSEIVDVSLLGEDALPILEDARARLLRPDGLILPAQLAARGALVGGAAFSEQCRMGRVSGFDLSAFNRLVPLTVMPELTGQTFDAALSEDVELFRFDFGVSARFPADSREVTLTARRAGVAEGLLQWIWLGFSHALQYDNRPPAESAWHPVLHVFAEPLTLQAGELVRLHLAHDRKAISVWPVPP